MWPKVHAQVMTGLVLAQLVLTFIFAIKKTVWAPIITAITLLGSVIFHLMVVKQFNPPQAQMSYRAATDADHSDEVRRLQTTSWWCNVVVRPSSTGVV